VRHFRSLAIAFVVLGLSAGAVFAARSLSDASTVSNTGLARAQAVSGQTPATGAGPQAAPAKAAEPDEQGDSTTNTDASTGTGKPADNHGAIVSSAAQLSFDELKALCAASGFAGTNKGAYMSAIARGELVVTVATVTDGTTGTGLVATSCAMAPDSTSGTTKLHGKANAAAKQAEHQPRP
jgi:hypothetical protein